jgi:hypothetical protein
MNELGGLQKLRLGEQKPDITRPAVAGLNPSEQSNRSQDSV